MSQLQFLVSKTNEMELLHLSEDDMFIALILLCVL